MSKSPINATQPVAAQFNLRLRPVFLWLFAVYELLTVAVPVYLFYFAYQEMAHPETATDAYTLIAEAHSNLVWMVAMGTAFMIALIFFLLVIYRRTFLKIDGKTLSYRWFFYRKRDIPLNDLLGFYHCRFLPNWRLVYSDKNGKQRKMFLQLTFLADKATREEIIFLLLQQIEANASRATVPEQ